MRVRPERTARAKAWSRATPGRDEAARGLGCRARHSNERHAEEKAS